MSDVEHDLTLAALAIHDEVGAMNSAAMCSLLDVPEDEAKAIIKAAADRSERAFMSAVLEYGPTRSDVHYLVLLAVRVGVELGIAAERMRRS